MADIPPVAVAASIIKHDIMTTQRHHKHRYHRRLSQIATSLLSAIIYLHSFSSSCDNVGVVGVDALPRDRNNKKDLPATNSLNALHRRNHGTGRSTSSVVLHDSFPCESAADQQHRIEQELQGVSASTGNNSNTGGGVSPPTTSEIGTVGSNSNNSNDTDSEINPLGTRGGGAEHAFQMTNDLPSLLLNDDMLDQLVEELINATSAEEPIVEDVENAVSKEWDNDALVDGQDGDIDVQSNNCLSIIDTPPTKSDMASGTIPTVIHWIRTRLLSIYQSILALCRKLQKLCMMQQQNFESDSIARMRFEQRNNIMNDGRCTNQKYNKHSKRSLFSVLNESSHCRRNAFEKQTSAKMQKRFTFHVSLNNNASTSTNQGRANSHSRPATNSKLSPPKLSSRTSPLKQTEQKSPSPRMDIAQLQSQLMQKKSSSILFRRRTPTSRHRRCNC